MLIPILILLTLNPILIRILILNLIIIPILILPCCVHAPRQKENWEN